MSACNVENTLKLINSANTGKIVCKFKDFRKKAIECSAHIFFIKQCIRDDLRPSFISFRIRASQENTRTQLGKWLIRKWLNSELRKWHGNKDKYTKLAYACHLRLLRDLDFECDDLVFSVNQTCTNLLKNLRDKKKEKLQKLKTSTNNAQHQTEPSNEPIFHQRVVNLSNAEFTKEEEYLLSRGLKYAIPPTIPQARLKNRVIAEIAAQIRNTNDLDCPSLRKIMKERFHIPKINPNEKNTLTLIRKKVHDNQLVIARADKGASVVILDQAEYTEKVESFLRANNANEHTCNIITHNDKVKKAIKNSSRIIPTAKKYGLMEMNPKIPRLYGQMKIHKENAPIRPVISSISSPWYHLSKFLCAWFKTMTNFIPQHAVKNSFDLIERLDKLENVPYTARLTSFDVVSLYTRVPKQPAIKRMLIILEESKVDIETIKEFHELLRLCLDTNVCQFQGKIYQFKDGLQMGNPLSPLVADVFMDGFEAHAFQNSPQMVDVLFWARYVDDIICIYNCNATCLQAFLDTLNSYHPNIKFTLEVGGNNINFLDLSISLVSTSSNSKRKTFQFNVYRKPTFTDTTIDGNSFHPYAHKNAAYFSMVHRLLSLPLNPENYNKELATIKLIARRNHVKLNIDNLVKKKRYASALSQISTFSSSPGKLIYIRQPFLGNISYEIASILKKIGYRAAFYTVSSLRSISQVKDSIPLLDRNGVYRLSCNSCNAIYIGQTGRTLSCRINEHLTSWRKGIIGNSAFGNHLTAASHCFDKNQVNSVTLLHNNKKGKVLDKLEALEIITHTNNTQFRILNLDDEFDNCLASLCM